MGPVNRRFTDRQKLKMIAEYENATHPASGRSGETVLAKYEITRQDIYRFRQYLKAQGLYKVNSK